MVSAKIKSIVQFYQSAADTEQNNNQGSENSTRMSNTSDGIQRRIAKWSASLTVEFEKLFPNKLNGAMIVIDSQTFLASCPICHLSYSIILPSRKNSFYKQNFVYHLKQKHILPRNSIRLTVSNSNSVNSSMPPNFSRASNAAVPSDIIQRSSNSTATLSTIDQRPLPRFQTRSSRRMQYRN